MFRRVFRLAAAVTLGVATAGTVHAATCGNNASGFGAWKKEFAAEAQRAGVGQRGIQALMNAQYSTTTIAFSLRAAVPRAAARDPRRGLLDPYLRNRARAGPRTQRVS